MFTNIFYRIINCILIELASVPNFPQPHKEGETTQTRFTDDLWTSVYDKDGECAYDTNDIHRSSGDVYVRTIRKGITS